MLTPDIRFQGWTTDSWKRFLGLWKSRPASETEQAQPRGGLIVLHQGGKMRKMLHTRRGRLDLAPWPTALSTLAAEHEASWAMSAETGALEEIMERFGARARRADDLLAQSLLLLAIVRELIAEGRIDTWPSRLRGLPVPSENVARRALDAVCGDGQAIALGVFQDGELWTSITLRRRGRGFDVIAGPDELRGAMGVLSSDWRRDYRHLARAIEEHYAPLAFGCFAELEQFRDLQVDGRPGAWSRAVALRDIIVSPMPAAVGLAVGVDGVRYAASKLARVARAVDWLGLAEPAIASVRQRLDANGNGNGNGNGNDLIGLLGLNPLELLRNLLRR